MAETMMKMQMPALAVIGADHRIVRSTESFRKRYAAAQALCEDSPELEHVLTGRADTAVVSVGDLNVEIEAVTDAAGRRQAMLSLPPLEQAGAPDPPASALRDAAEDSPAIVWVKDLDGRYLYANARYLRDLNTSEERLEGNTDADLPEAETVDGPRRRYAEDGLEEPLQLEYTVPTIDRRPALAVFRFALRDDTGQPIGTCGVAAPVTEAHVARDEAVRLMQLERWNRLDPVDVKAEVLEQWHVQAAHGGGVEGALDEPEGAERTARTRDVMPAPTLEPEHAARVEEPRSSEADLQLARQWAERADQLQGEMHQAQAQRREAEAEAQRLRTAAELANEEAERWRSELEQAHAELERVHAEARAARSESEAARAQLGAARAQAESLRGPSTAALRLSEELARALAGERERGDELERALARIRTRLGDFETALERSPATQARAG